MSELESERDQNWLVQYQGTPCYVLKVANSDDGPELIDLQQSMMQRLRMAGLPCPVTSLTPTGKRWMEVDGHLAWLISYLPGQRLSEITDPSPTLLRNIGELLGRAAIALQGFDHPAAHRLLQWDVARADTVLSSYRSDITGRERQQIIDRALATYRAEVTPLLPRLPHSVIHNDANDHNVLLRGEAVTGLLDFGDAVHTVTVNDLAVACAYAMLGRYNPQAAAGHLIDGYTRHRRLSPPERQVLPHLIRIRLATSVAISARQRAILPGNRYLRVSEAPAWRLLTQLQEGLT